MTIPKPRPTGGRRLVDLTGYVFPWGDDEQPVLADMPGSERLYLCVFRTPAALRAFMAQAAIAFVSIKQIDDPREFVMSLPPIVAVAVDPRFDGGRVLFTQIGDPS